MISKIVLFISFFLVAVVCHSQLIQAGSKEQALLALTKNISDSSRQNLYNYLGKFYLFHSLAKKPDTDSAFYYLRKAVYLRDSVNYNNDEITNESLLVLAEAYISSGNLPTGKKICLQVIKNYQRFNQKMNEADTWRMMAEDLCYYHNTDPSIQACFDTAVQLCRQTNNLAEKAGMSIKKMNYFYATGKVEAAKNELKEILEDAKKNHFENLSEIYTLLSFEERYKGNLDKGLAYSLEAMKYLDVAKNKNKKHEFIGELAQIYEELGEAEKSVYWYKQCIAERLKLKDYPQYRLYRTYSLMTIQMLKANMELEALRLLNWLKENRPPSSVIERASLNQSIAYCYSAMKKYKLAETRLLEMIRDYEQSESNHELLHIAYYDIGKFYVDIQDFRKSQPYLKKAFEIGASTLTRTKDLYLLLFKVDSAGGNFKAAIKDLQNYNLLKDSIYNVAKSKQIEELKIKYEAEKKDHDLALKDNNIQLLTKQSQLQLANLRTEKNARNMVLVCTGMLFLLLGLGYNRYKLKQKSNILLEQQQKDIKEKNSYLQRLLQEKEWLVKEIHHRVKNNLHTISGLLDAQAAYLQTDEALIAISDSQHRVQAMSLLHQKLFHSESLSTVEMPGYINELVGYLEHSFGTGRSVKFKLNIDKLIFGLSHALPIGLILNEAITNAIKYAFPGSGDDTISIRLKKESAKHYLLSISDNGKGLPADFVSQQSSSMGMNLMRGLSEDILGVFLIRNNNGTEICISFVYDASTTEDFSFHEMVSQNS